MSEYESLNHTTWECKYHIVWIPKYRKKKLYAKIRKELGGEIRRLAECRESRILEGHMMGDHIHVLMAIPPKHSVPQVVGYIKGKSAIFVARRYGGRENISADSMCGRGDILYRQSDAMRMLYADTYRIRRVRTKDWIQTWACSWN